MKGYKKLIGRGETNGRFYKVKVKQAGNLESVAIQRVSEFVYNNIIDTYQRGQTAVEEYLEKQIRARKVAAESRNEKRLKKLEMRKKVMDAATEHEKQVLLKAEMLKKRKVAMIIGAVITVVIIATVIYFNK